MAEAVKGEQRVAIKVTVNGALYERSVPVRRLLSDFLRHDLRLTGTHVGCEHGVCGCCTVLLDGRAARSCLMLACQVDGCSLRTIEGVQEPDGALHPVQRALRDCHGLQCGYCTPGFVMSIIEVLDSPDDVDLSEDGVREVIAGNLCRCTGYQGIVDAFRRAATEMGRAGGATNEESR
ncbi:MAG: (2Fe-2S)-binding protein [Acidimicrobiales bacterium]